LQIGFGDEIKRIPLIRFCYLFGGGTKQSYLISQAISQQCNSLNNKYVWHSK